MRPGVERGIAASGLPRSEVQLTSKLRGSEHAFDSTWRAFVRLREEGRIGSIGVSNFQPAHIDRLLSETGVLPAVNQIELHPDFTQAALRAWHARQGIVIASWSPLGRGAIRAVGHGQQCCRITRLRANPTILSGQ